MNILALIKWQFIGGSKVTFVVHVDKWKESDNS
jgi:hypothetical protein